MYYKETLIITLNFNLHVCTRLIYCLVKSIWFLLSNVQLLF